MNDTSDGILNDYICDYVDGTMDPVVQQVFEEYMEQNWSVREYVLDVIEGRYYLTSLPEIPAPEEMETELRYKIELDKHLDRIEKEEESLGKTFHYATYGCIVLIIIFAAVYGGMML